MSGVVSLTEALHTESKKRPRYGFVVPRFKESIAGGAETLAGQLAMHLAARGDEVEILTTCALDNRTWNNELPAGASVEGGVTVHRFPVDARDLEVWIPRQIHISEGMRLGAEEELLWLTHSVNSTALYQYIAEQGKTFDALFFAPYLFGTTFWGSLIHPENSVLIPCLHDEHAAYTECVGSMFRQVRGALFNAAAEGDLARALYGNVQGGEVGMGFDPLDPEDTQRLAPYFAEKFPYVLYVGRKETGKNVQTLIDYFVAAKAAKRIGEEVKLVIAGGGSFSDLGRPAALTRDDILDIQHVSELDKKRLLRFAAVLCQPSTNESFSIVIMEAWRLETPVLVNAACAVTRDHAVQSGGGLYYRTADEFGEVVQELVENRALATQLGAAGKRYVETRYSWDAVLNRFDQVMEELR